MKELIAIQAELKAPKGKRNNFGNFNYRSAEDILEAVKPLLAKYNCLMTLTDDLVQFGERIFVKTTVEFSAPDGKSKSVTAFAEHAPEKKGMDVAQITGSASSYARKYALSGLLLIDDERDADMQNASIHTAAPVAPGGTPPSAPAGASVSNSTWPTFGQPGQNAPPPPPPPAAPAAKR